ncbi:O-antigen ligase family protein [Trinickia sp.]|uniref:O-antigen ligase family protein n=1 Tax=Trinickia sp. TaxID=2571163 RepID=UPI003F80266B
MNKIDLDEIAFWLLGLAFVLYVYRIDVLGVNLTLLRIVSLGLIGRGILLVCMRGMGAWRVRWSTVILLGATFFVVVINAMDYRLLFGWPDLQKPIIAHIFNILTLLSIAAFIDNEKKFNLAIRAYVLSSAAALVIAYYAFFMGDIPFASVLREYGSDIARSLQYLNVNGNVVRLTGPFFDPNFYGIYLLSVIVFSGWLYIYVERNKIYLVLIGVSGLSLILTGSRTALMGLGVAYVLYIALEAERKRAHWWGLLITMLVGAIAFTAKASTGHWSDTASIVDRFRFYQPAWNAFQENIFFGGGSLALLDKESGVSTAHMVYLTLLGKYGLVGTIFYLVLIFCPVAYVHFRRKFVQRNYRNLVLFLYAPLGVMYLSYDFMAYLEFQYFMFAIGYVIVMYRFSESRRGGVGIL